MNVHAYNASNDLRKWIEDRFVPVVLVGASTSAERIVQKNRVSLVDLLRPFERLTKDVHTRGIKEDGAYCLKGFGIRLRTLEDLRSPREDVRAKYFSRVVQQSTAPNDGALEQMLFESTKSPCPGYPNQVWPLGHRNAVCA